MDKKPNKINQQQRKQKSDTELMKKVNEGEATEEEVKLLLQKTLNFTSKKQVKH